MRVDCRVVLNRVSKRADDSSDDPPISAKFPEFLIIFPLSMAALLHVAKRRYHDARISSRELPFYRAFRGGISQTPKFEADGNRNIYIHMYIYVRRKREREREGGLSVKKMRDTLCSKRVAALTKGLPPFLLLGGFAKTVPFPRDIKMDQGTVQSCAVLALIRQVVELLRECYLNMLIPTWPVGSAPE